MTLPPRWVRRLVLWPLPLVLVWVYLVSVPLLVVVATVMSHRFPGKLRLLRSVGLATVYAFVEVAVVVASFGLWLAAGLGTRLDEPRWQQRHHDLLRWALQVLVGAGRRLFVLDIEVEGVVRTPDGPVPASEWEGPRALPLVVMSRHAGPADSILLLHEVTTRFGRRPRIVLKAALQWDPAFDILLNRLPNGFVGGRGGHTSPVEAVRALAAGMDGRDAFVIFPEGGNVTEARRERSIRWLEEHGRTVEADRARAMTHVMPPRTGGALAAMDGSPDAALVFVAHTGLDEIEGLADLWRAIPDHKVLEMVFAAVPPDAVPADDADRVELLWHAWEGIDRWIGEQSRHR